MIKALIFDYGGVVANYTDPYVFEDIANKFNLSLGLAVSTIYSLLPAYQIGRMPQDEFWQTFSKQVKKDLPLGYESLWTDRYASTSIRDPFILQLIKNLKASGYKLAVISNTIPDHANYNREQGNFDLFDVVVLSNEVNIRKPNKEIFKIPSDSFGVQPKNCIYIDDIRKYLNVAAELGISTIHYANYEWLNRSKIQIQYCVDRNDFIDYLQPGETNKRALRGKHEKLEVDLQKFGINPKPPQTT